MAISIALTKGRLEENAVMLMEKAGFGIEELKNKGRKLIFNDSKEDIRYFLVKAKDTITYVEHGAADIAIVGKDTLLEAEPNYYEVLDLAIGQCKFIVAALPNVNLFNTVGHVKIGSKYPKVAKDYFKSKIEGSVELGPLLGICQGIVDIMETGTTLKENGLIVLDEICDISARIIVNKTSYKLKRKEINVFLDRIKAVI